MKAKKVQNGRTASRAVRRRQLIDAAIDSISKRGFSGTTLATVTQTANLSHGVVNFHFESKESLYLETLGHLVEEHYACWREALDSAGAAPALQLAAILNADFDSKICEPKKLAVWFAFWGQARQRPAYLDVHHRHDDERGAEILRLCRELVADGPYPEHDATALTRTIEALVDGLWLNLLLYPKAMSREQACADCFRYLETVFPHHFPIPGMRTVQMEISTHDKQ